VPVLDEIAEQLINGRGFQRISGLPVDRLGADDASWIYWGVGMHLGVPWAQNAKGHLLGDVKDQGKALDDPTARGNEIGGSALGSIPTARILSGCCVSIRACRGREPDLERPAVPQPAGGIGSRTRRRPLRGAALRLPGEQAADGKPYYRVPAFSRQGGRLFVRYIPQFILASQRHESAPRLTATQKAAMKAYSALVDDPDHWVEMSFDAGDMQFVNNYHVLHGRREYVDDTESGRIRWLKRLWLATEILGPEDRPDRFQAAGATAHWSAKRTKA
jgi:hypothetical protein